MAENITDLTKNITDLDENHTNLAENVTNMSENNRTLCESSDNIMTILDQMAESVQLDYTDQFSKDVEPSSSGLLEIETIKVCFRVR